MFLRYVLPVCAVCLFSSSLHADTTLTFFNQSAQNSRTQTLHIAGTQLRMDLVQDSGRQSMLFDTTRRQLTMLDPQNRSFVVLDEAAASRLNSNRAAPTLPRRIVRTGRLRTVGGYACQIIEVYQGAQRELDWCIASPDSLGLTPDEYTTFESWMSVLAQVTGENAGLLVDLAGLPISTVDYRQKEAQSVTELTTVNNDALAASLFQIPDGYTRVEPF